MAAFSVHIDFGAQDNEVWHNYHCFPTHLPSSEGTRCPDLSFLDVEVFFFFSLSFFFLAFSFFKINLFFIEG